MNGPLNVNDTTPGTNIYIEGVELALTPASAGTTVYAGPFVPDGLNADWDATVGPTEILNKPTIPAAPVNADWVALSGLAQVYNKPTIPAAQVNSDWNATSGIAQVLNQPTIPAAQVSSDWNATTGVAQVLNKPTYLPQVNADWNATTGLSAILNKPGSLTQYPPLFMTADSSQGCIASAYSETYFPAWYGFRAVQSGNPPGYYNYPAPGTSGYTQPVATYNSCTGSGSSAVCTYALNGAVTNSQPYAGTPLNATGSSEVYGEWIQLQLPGTIALGTYSFSQPGAFAYLNSWTICGSNNNQVWTVVDTQTNNTTYSASEITITPSTSSTTQYAYYRMIVTAVSPGTAGRWCIANLYFTGATTSGTSTTQVNSDWNSVSGVSQIYNKPTIIAQVNSDWNANSNAGVSYIKNVPTWATVAYTGKYSDLSGQPTATSNTTWLGVNYATGWSDAIYTSTDPNHDFSGGSTGGVQYRLNEFGTCVHIRGCMITRTVPPTTGGAPLLFTLPQGYWPTTSMYFTVSANGTWAQMNITTTGQARAYAVTPGSIESGDPDWEWDLGEFSFYLN